LLIFGKRWGLRKPVDWGRVSTAATDCSHSCSIFAANAYRRKFALR
jgi:hypothetical protein